MATDQHPGWSAVTHPRPGEAGSPLLVASTDGRRRPGDRTFIVVQGIRSWIEPFEMQRFALIAERLRARLVIVETPGFGTPGSRLLAPERRALRQGDFGPVAARMFTAARTALEEGDAAAAPVSFLGYSLGASIAAAMACAAAEQGWPVSEVVLVEPVALHRWRALHLLAASWREDRRLDDYLSCNEDIPHVVAPWDRRPGTRPPNERRRDLLALALALRHGRLYTDLLATPARRLVIIRGDRSALSTAAGDPPLADLQRRGIPVAEMSIPGHHALWHSLPAVDALARTLRKVLDSPR
ncbi:hypothetical protein ACJEIK_28330 [Mycobacterium sp. SMC-16]|uniref:hypothetical protein n=1 Tax=Mycobacterium sp. SMC-16 TaxID=3385967 RepID=UPI00390C7AC6